jgi:hypothetical protein
MARLAPRPKLGGALIITGGLIALFVLGTAVSTLIPGWADFGYVSWALFIALPLIYVGGRMRPRKAPGHCVDRRE